VTIFRVSMGQVRVRDSVYHFSSSDLADQFLTCLLFDELGECEIKHPPVAKKTIRVDPDDLSPGA
jgi:hypothetical protein